MTNNQNAHKFDLEDRTLEFAKKVIDLLKQLPRSSINLEMTSQIVRSAGSVGANYREANDALGKKDFYMRMKICRKEAKETKYWLELILHNNSELKEQILLLIGEVTELIKIFSSILNRVV